MLSRDEFVEIAPGFPLFAQKQTDIICFVELYLLRKFQGCGITGVFNAD